VKVIVALDSGLGGLVDLGHATRLLIDNDTPPPACPITGA
jgi:hypothetical protein